MNLFSKLGGNLIEERIKTEAQKLIDEHASSAAVNSLFPRGRGTESVFVKVKGVLTLEIVRACIGYTQHTGHDEAHITSLAPQRKTLEVNSTIALGRTFAQNGKKINLEARAASLELSGMISGIDFTEMFFGMGATIDSLDFRILLNGSLSASEE